MKTTSPSGKPGLERVMGPITASAVVIGTVIGSGVFKKPQLVALNAPYFGLAALAWVGTGLFILLGALAYAEVAVLYPRAGGNYVFLREAYGRLAGFLWGWVEFWIIRAASIAALATIFSESLHDVLRNPAFQQAVGLPPGDVLSFWELKGLTIAVIVVLAAVNVRGVKWGGGLQVVVTVVKVASLLAIVAAPFVLLAFVRGGSAIAPQPAHLEPTWPASWAELPFAGMGAAFLGVYWAYHGWMNITPVAEEVREPQRNLPLALLAGVGTIIFLYLGANFAYYLILSGPEMAGLKDTTVATVFSMRLLGPLGAAAASAAVMCSVFGALNGNLLVGPRLLYAMGQDGLVPKALQTVDARFHTPALATWVLAAWSCLLVVGVAVLNRVGGLRENAARLRPVDRLRHVRLIDVRDAGGAVDLRVPLPLAGCRAAVPLSGLSGRAAAVRPVAGLCADEHGPQRPAEGGHRPGVHRGGGGGLLPPRLERKPRKTRMPTKKCRLTEVLSYFVVFRVLARLCHHGNRPRCCFSRAIFCTPRLSAATRIVRSRDLASP